MLGPGPHASPRHLSAACVVLLATLAAAHVLGDDRPVPDASYRAGYAAATQTHEVAGRTADAFGPRPATWCEHLFEDRRHEADLAREAFVDGCTRAVADAME
jgi:hypothetical protein